MLLICLFSFNLSNTVISIQGNCAKAFRRGWTATAAAVCWTFMQKNHEQRCIMILSVVLSAWDLSWWDRGKVWGRQCRKRETYCRPGEFVTTKRGHTHKLSTVLSGPCAKASRSVCSAGVPSWANQRSAAAAHNADSAGQVRYIFCSVRLGHISILWYHVTNKSRNRHVGCPAVFNATNQEVLDKLKVERQCDS